MKKNKGTVVHDACVKMTVISLACTILVAIPMTIYLYPLFMSWGWYQEASNALFFVPLAVFVGVFFLLFLMDIKRMEKEKQSKLTGIMVSIPYTYWAKTKNAEVSRQKQFDKGVTEIDLSSRKIRSIDLSVLKQFMNLEHLDLSNNDIRQIDLKPLEWCDNLLGIYLTRNNLTSIDLDPLRNITKLQTLYLADNELLQMDLSPLMRCTELRELHLQENKLQSLDLVPLRSCTKLVNLFTNDNTIQILDITPLQSCMNFDVIDFGEATLVTSISLDEGKWPRALRALSAQIEML